MCVILRLDTMYLESEVCARLLRDANCPDLRSGPRRDMQYVVSMSSTMVSHTHLLLFCNMHLHSQHLSGCNMQSLFSTGAAQKKGISVGNTIR